MVVGSTALHKYGHRLAVGTSYETLWSEGSLYSYRTEAATLTISSSDASDDAQPPGDGARTVTVYGLDGNFAEVSETASLNGQTGVTLTNSYIRVNRMIVRTAGGDGTNAGIVYVGSGAIASGKPATVDARIDAAMGQTLMSVYTVPAGKTLLVSNVYANIAGQRGIAVALMARPTGEVMQIKWLGYGWQASASQRFDSPLVFAAQTDVELRAKVDSTTADIAGGFDGVVIDGT